MPVYKRGETWQINFSVRGQRYIRSAGQNCTKKQASELEAKYRAQIIDDLSAERFGKSKNRTYKEAVARWLQQGAPSSMRSHTKITLEYLGEAPLAKILDEVSWMKSDMKNQGMKPATINRRLAVVKRILHLAYSEWNWLSTPLHDKIKKSAEHNARSVFLTPDEVEVLAKSCDNHTVGDIVRLIAYTGLRRGEVLKLKAGDFKNGMLTLRSETTKSKKSRSIPVPPALHHVLESLPLAVKPDQLRYCFDRARERSGMHVVHLHDLRHTCASWLAKAGVPMGVIRDWLGHSTIQMSSRYIHFAENQLVDAMNKMIKQG